MYIFQQILAREREKRDVFSRQNDDVSENLGTYEGDMEFMDAGRSNNGQFSQNGGMDEFKHYKLKNNKSLMSRRHHGCVIRPLDSLESCVAAQLCNEHEEYMHTSRHSSSLSVLRPLLGTDGNRIISRAGIDSSGLCSVGRPDKPRESRRPTDEMKLFVMGITFGLFSMVMANNRDVERLSKNLKQSQNLVQDLREELEMRDVLTVNELVVDEASQILRVDGKSSTVSSSTSSEKRNDSMVEDSEVRNTIEAELEAELERLELNLKASCLERVNDYVELDQDLEATVIQGNIKVNVPTRKSDGESESESDDEARNNYCESPYYAVSPRELRLRLHEVIEARLEKRIKELETALESSENRLHSQRREPITSGEVYNEEATAYVKMLGTTNSDKEETAQEMDNNGIDKRRSRRTSEEEVQTSTSLRSNEKCESDDELDMLLIKRIVERRRSGSIVFVNGT